VGSPLGIEAVKNGFYFFWADVGLNGVGSPLGIEAQLGHMAICGTLRLNGVGSPLGIEANQGESFQLMLTTSKWRGKPVRG
jgi:hypothetical protein